MNDKNGRKVRIGDVVRFFAGPERGWLRGIARVVRPSPFHNVSEVLVDNGGEPGSLIVSVWAKPNEVEVLEGACWEE